MANWLWDNRDWLFSGLGVVVLTTFATLTWRLARRRLSARPRMTAATPTVTTSAVATSPARGTPPGNARRISSLAFAEIMREMINVPPLQIDAIGARYIGVWVEWATWLSDARITSDEVAITLDCGPGEGFVRCTVKLSDYKELYYIRKGEPITVIGAIERVEPGTVFLGKVELIFARDKGS